MSSPNDGKAEDAGTYDFVIVGAGSAGSVLAKRLSEESGVTVLVLEAGGSDKALTVQMPAALSLPMNSKRFNWGLKTEPEPGLDGRVMNLPRGKGLGGSSSINGMCYVRGNPMDYELWSALGAKDWHWANVLPYFQRMESVAGGGDLRGTGGPLRVTRGPEKNPLYRTFGKAGVEAGYALSANMNERQHEGFGPMEMTVADGLRCSAARAYLRPAQATGRVRVITKALAERVLFEGKRAIGVSFQQGGRRKMARAGRAVILCAGSIMSPAILKRSGIGPGAELSALGITTLVDLAGVGENLMDHLELYIQQECVKPITLFSSMNALAKLGIGLRWLATRKGLGATNHFESGGHIRSRAGIVYPDIQYHFLPLAISYDGVTLAKGHGFQVHVGTKRSKSRGWVRLSSADAQQPPKVRFNYMTHPDDWLEMRAAIRFSREIFSQPAFAPYRGQELAPGAAAQSDEALDDFIKRKVESAYHPCGTCRMGEGDGVVVDSQGRVKGVEALLVIDASVMPQATAGDLNAPTLMLAERMADLLRGRSLPAADDAPLLADAHWKSRQRAGAIALDYATKRQELAEYLLANARGIVDFALDAG